ncbi:MAG: glycosyltransferase family 39 protein [Sedimentisphaerales bacterium]|nr:glycosyltransferase family 39 protein [Sedimentisphaerales bacterium]
MDEVWDASIGYEFATTGMLRQPFIHNFGGMEVYFMQPRVLLPVICSGVFKLTDYSIAASRLPSLILGLLAVIALYHAAGKLFNSKQSFFITLAVIINPWFWLNCRRCRPEIYCTAFGLFFLWLVILYFRKDRPLYAFLAGMMVALALLSHINGLIITAAISISWLIWKEKPHLLKFVFWALPAFILTILPYVIYTFWADRYPDVSFLEQMRINSPHASALVGLKGEITRWRIFLQLPLGIPFALVMFGSLVTAWWRSASEDKFAATVVIIYILVLPFFTVNVIADYLLAAVPFFCVLIVRFICRLSEFSFLSRSKRIHYIIRLCVILIYVATSLSPIAIMFYRLSGKGDFNHVIKEVTKVIEPGSKVDAISVFWIGHKKYEYGPYLMTYSGALSLKDALEWAYSQSFDYSIRTSWNGDPLGFKKLPDNMPEFRPYYITDNICKMFGTKVHEFYSEYYGPMEIYKIDWSNAYKHGLRRKEIK